jgi:G3E family GTPase
VELEVRTEGHYALFLGHDPDEFDLTVTTAEGQAVAWTASRAFAGGHSHDDEVGSVGITFGGDLYAKKVSEFLSEYTQTFGADIFRFKGILSIKGEKQRFVFQGVHMLFDGTFDRPWGTSERRNQVVFIGRNLDRDAIEAGFAGCLA